MYKCYIQLPAICSFPSIWCARATGCDDDNAADDDDANDEDDDNLGQGKPCECLGSGRGNFPASEAAGTGQWASS